MLSEEVTFRPKYEGWGKENSRSRAWPMSSLQTGLSAAFMVLKTGWWWWGGGGEFAEREAMLGPPPSSPLPLPPSPPGDRKEPRLTLRAGRVCH